MLLNVDRRTLAATCHVARAKVTHHGQTQKIGQKRPVADLPRETLGWPMQHCVSMEANDILWFESERGGSRETTYRLEVWVRRQQGAYGCDGLWW